MIVTPAADPMAIGRLSCVVPMLLSPKIAAVVIRQRVTESVLISNISFIRPMRRRLVPADGLVFQSLRGDDTPQFVGVVPPPLVKSTTEKIRVIEACEPGRRTGQRRAEGRWLVLVIPRGAPRGHRLCYYY